MPKQPVYPRLAPAEQHALLRRILTRASHTPSAEPAPVTPTPVVVLDLDGTLLDNRPRTCAILRAFAEAHGDPELSALLLAARPEALPYLLSDTLEQLGIHDTETVARIAPFWRERFFADGHLVNDVATPGAVAFARACYDAGAILAYLTARDLPTMGVGTFRSLRDRGFPIGLPGTELILKPDAAMPDEGFKRLIAPGLARIGDVVAVFDNEPANCNIFRALYPAADVVLLDTLHMPGAPSLAEGIHIVGDFVVPLEAPGGSGSIQG